MKDENITQKGRIKGWGQDADPRNEPTYPMKNYTGDDHQRLDWERPPLQEVSQEVLRSIERPSNSAVVGETIPPRGLSGQLRRYAFTFSESQFGHWIPLLIADRIDEVEGVIEDLSKGRIPNIFAERGGRAALKYNKKAVIKKIAVASLCIGVCCLLLKKKNLSNKYTQK